MTAEAKEGGPSSEKFLLSLQIPLLSPPLSSPAVLFSLLLSPLLSSPISYFLSSPSLSSSFSTSFPPPPPRFLPCLCFSQCGEHSHCWPLSSELGTGVQGSELLPEVPFAPKYLLLCLPTKINTLILSGDSHCPLCLWKVMLALVRSGWPQCQCPQCPHRGLWLRIQSTQPAIIIPELKSTPACISSVIQQPLMTCQFLALPFSV